MISYSVDMQNAKPTGRIQATGSFGPLTPKNLGGTPVSGNFTFSSVNLREIGGISGMLSAKGHFSGALAAQRLTFQIPGAAADLNGSYDLHDIGELVLPQ